MSTFARASIGALLVSAAWAGAHAQQPGPQPAEPTAAQAAAAEAPPADPVEVEEDSGAVIVTGTRTPKAVDKIPGAITVIGAADVNRSLAITEDATAVLAKTVPGYSESSQTLNTLGETMRGRTALYLFDGIPQSTPLRDGSRNASFTDMSVVERIEVIGGASASEGIGAAGGVINYISKRATRDGLHLNVGGRLGTQFEDDSGIWGIKGDLAYKGASFDVFAAAAYVDRGITYDARGRRIGLSASSSLADSTQKNFFLKAGSDFGAQRVELVGSWFKLKGKNNYFYQAGVRPPAGTDQTTGIPDTAVRGQQLVGGINILRPDFNDFKQAALNYSHTDLLGGSLVATGYFARQRMRFPGDNSADRQDPLIAPLGTLVDQSEVNSKKYGLRTSYTRPDFLIDGLELRFGIDAVHDTTDQRLALTDRVWVPPLKYTSYGPYFQLSWDIGPVTLSGGLRHEDGRIKVDDYTTTFFRGRRFVTGGTLKYKNDLLNAGAIWRIGGGFSVFGSYSEGFTLPNVGIPLRNVNVANQSVAGILDLQAVIFENKEFGANWRGSWGSFGVSRYNSYSKLAAGLSVDPVTQDFILNRRPQRIKGWDVTAEVRPTTELRFNAVYSAVKGKTSRGNNILTPLDLDLGIVNLAPNKLNASVSWMPTPDFSLSFGMDKIESRTVQVNPAPAAKEVTKGRTLFDATVKYRIENVGTVSLGAENLFNKFYFLAFSQVDFFQNYFAGRGRTVTLSLRSDF